MFTTAHHWLRGPALLRNCSRPDCLTREEVTRELGGKVEEEGGRGGRGEEEKKKKTHS